MKIAKLGSHLSEEAKKKIGDANRGRTWTEQQKTNLRAAKANRVSARKGGMLCQFTA
jgi:hypothetical protein